MFPLVNNPPSYYPTLPTSPSQPNTSLYYPPQVNALIYNSNVPNFLPPSYPSYSASTSTRPDFTNPTPFNPFIKHIDVPDPFILAIYTSSNEPLVALIPIFDQQTLKTDICFYDSAANSHVFYDRSTFDTYKTILPLPIKCFKHDLSTMAIGHGTVYLQGRHGVSLFPIIFPNVLHIPGA